MFEKKLEEAARKSRQQLFVLLLLVAILILGGAVAFLITQLSLQQTSNVSGIEAEKKNIEISPKISPVQQSKPADEKIKQNRTTEEVVGALRRYEEEFEGIIQSGGFGKWNGSLQHDLITRKDKVITDLANGETDRAFEEVNNLIADASTAVSEYEIVFEEAMANAIRAYEAEDVTRATIEVERALELKPDDAVALELQEKIKKLPQLFELMEKARVANIENNLEEERNLSVEIIRLDPTRVLYQERIEEIDVLLREARFEKIVTSGLIASKKEQLGNLQSAYDQANALFPSREETKNLASLLKELKRELRFRTFVKEGDTAIQQDNWRDALASYQNASALYPDKIEVQEAISLSQKILRMSGEVQGFLKNASRLSVDNIRQAAEQAIADAEIYSAMSPALANDVERLQTEIIQRNKEIEVWVLSDKLTNVTVRGVGKVGMVERYKIRLKPGQYTFEGRREGFRTKSVQITISPEDSQLEVTVKSDERI
ncbi:hypothetical protein [Sneathiella sp. HT1-7]|jgi:tetratricopeptide (TPR) repeat protein|uniref:hypothetical protein n=1 Tax=Sneathiella sp. HT1-7 TaxID=2887192 RepID=UPI001D152742|nr:hypothetical protein [Sneathiella sp. HT1-7]MCC3305193.1 hypothetical protein [Sneathiella sp. HT1-7]